MEEDSGRGGGQKSGIKVAGAPGNTQVGMDKAEIKEEREKDLPSPTPARLFSSSVGLLSCPEVVGKVDFLYSGAINSDAGLNDLRLLFIYFYLIASSHASLSRVFHWCVRGSRGVT